jgi:hypothetical protein
MKTARKDIILSNKFVKRKQYMILSEIRKAVVQEFLTTSHRPMSQTLHVP